MSVRMSGVQPGSWLSAGTRVARDELERLSSSARGSANSSVSA